MPIVLTSLKYFNEVANEVANEYEDAIKWLIDAGLIYKVNRVRSLKKPLHFYEDKEAFKLFFIDLGLLGALTKTRASDVVIDDSVFSEYKGSFTEQYILQQYVTSTNALPYYYSKDNSTLELDFITETSTINPIEVKAEENVYSKSLKLTLETDPTFTGWRFSMKNYIEQERIINIPLYSAFNWFEQVICQ